MAETRTGSTIYGTLRELAEEFARRNPGMSGEGHTARPFQGDDGQQYIQIYIPGAEGVPFIGVVPAGQYNQQEPASELPQPEPSGSELRIDVPVPMGQPASEQAEEPIVDTTPEPRVQGGTMPYEEPIEEPIEDVAAVKRPDPGALQTLKILGGSVASGLLFPSRVAGQVGDLITGQEGAVTRGVKQWDKKVDDFVGMTPDQYNVIEKAAHIMGNVVPLPYNAPRTGLQLATEILTPAVPAKMMDSVGKLAASIGIPTAIWEGVDQLSKPSEPREDTLQRPRLTPQTMARVILAGQDADAATAAAPAKAPTVAQAETDQRTRELIKEARAELSLDPAALLSVAGGAAVAGVMRRTPAQKKTHTAIVPEPQTPMSTRAERTFVDSYAPVNNLIQDEGLRAKLQSRTRPASVASHMEYTLRTGRLPDGSVLSVSPKTTDDLYAKLRPEQADAFKKAMAAGDELDWRAAGLSTERKNTMFQGVDDFDLRKMVYDAQQDPAVRRMMQLHRQEYDAWLRVMRNKGLITPEKYDELRLAQPNYFPRNVATKKDLGLVGRQLDKVIGTLESATEGKGLNIVSSMVKRDTPPHHSTLMDPASALVQTREALNKLIMHNDVRRDIIDDFIKRKLKFGNDRLVQKAKMPSENTITVYRNGKAEHYEILSPDVRNVLEFAPLEANRFMNWTRLTVQNYATGIGRDAISTALTGVPIRTLINSVWEPITLKMLKHPDMRFNTVDMITAVPRGTWHAIHARMNDWAGHVLERSILLDGEIAKMLGPQTAAAMRDRLKQKFADSVIGTMMREGGTLGHRYKADDTLSQTTAIARTSPRLYAEITDGVSPAWSRGMARAVGNQVHWLHDAINNASRVHYAARNLSPNMPQEEVTKVVNNAARVSGDYRQRGTSSLMGSVPYLNTQMQVYNALGRALNSPTAAALFTARTMSLTAASVFTAYMAAKAIGPERFKQWLDETTPESRARGVPIPGIDGIALLPIPPEASIPVAAALEAFFDLSGLRDGSFADPENAWNKAGDAFWGGAFAGTKRMVGEDMPLAPVYEAGLALTGQRAGMFEGAKPISTSRLDPSGEAKAFNDVITANVGEAINALAAQAATLGMAFVNGYANTRSSGDDVFSRNVDYAIGGWQRAQQKESENVGRILGFNRVVETAQPYAKEVREKMQGIREIQNAVSRLKVDPAETSNTKYSIARPAPIDIAPDRNLQVVDQVIEGSSKEVSDISMRLSQLYNARDGARNASAMPSEAFRAMSINEINREINLYNKLLHSVIDRMEQQLTSTLGRPFRFEKYQPLRSGPPEGLPSRVLTGQ